METNDKLFEANKLSQFTYLKDGQIYDLQEMNLNLNNEYIFDKIVNGEPLTTNEMTIEELFIGDDTLKLQLMNPTSSEHSITVIKKLRIKSDHDGYCSGEENEFEAELKYEIYNTTNYVCKDESNGNCECNINYGGSGYCTTDYLTEKYCGRHNCVHKILEKHVLDFKMENNEENLVINI